MKFISITQSLVKKKIKKEYDKDILVVVIPELVLIENLVFIGFVDNKYEPVVGYCSLENLYNIYKIKEFNIKDYRSFQEVSWDYLLSIKGSNTNKLNFHRRVDGGKIVTYNVIEQITLENSPLFIEQLMYALNNLSNDYKQQDIEKDRKRNEALNNNAITENTVIIETEKYTPIKYLNITFYDDKILLTDGNKFQNINFNNILEEHKCGILNYLLKLTNRYIKDKGFNLAKNYNRIIEVISINTPATFIKLLLILNGNVIPKTKSINKAVLLKELTYPIELDYTRIIQGFNDIINHTHVLVDMSRVSTKSELLRKYKYLGDYLFINSVGDAIHIKSSIYMTQFKSKDEMNNRIRKDINNIINDFYTILNNNDTLIRGDHSPINYYKPIRYGIIGGDLEIVFKLKIADYEIEKDALDVAANKHFKK